jgi:hypothetical protein
VVSIFRYLVGDLGIALREFAEDNGTVPGCFVGRIPQKVGKILFYSKV